MLDEWSTPRVRPGSSTPKRPVVLAEKGRRTELTVELGDLTRSLFYAGLTFADRNTIGTEATLNAATARG